METSRRRTPFFRAACGVLVIFVSTLAAVVEINAGWKDLRMALQDIFEGIWGTLVTLLDWFFASILIPRYLIYLALFVAVVWAVRFVSRIRKTSKVHRAKFRELWLFFHIDSKTKLPIVENRHVGQARCGECMGKIVSTDVGRSGRFVSYLKCENGHFVGGEKSYSQYQKEMEKAHLESERMRVEKEQERDKVIRDFEAGNITQEEFDKFMNSSAGPKGAYLVAPDFSPPASAQELYDQVVGAFEDDYLKQYLAQIKTFPLEKSH